MALRINTPSPDLLEHDSEHEEVHLVDDHSSPVAAGRSSKNSPLKENVTSVASSRSAQAEPQAAPAAPQAGGASSGITLPPQDGPRTGEASGPTSPAELRSAMSDLNGDLEALQDQRDEIASLQKELEELRSHAAAINEVATANGGGGDVDVEKLQLASSALDAIHGRLGDFEQKFDSVSAKSPARRSQQGEAAQNQDKDQGQGQDHDQDQDHEGSRNQQRQAAGQLRASKGLETQPLEEAVPVSGADQLKQLQELQGMAGNLKILEQQLAGLTAAAENSDSRIGDIADLRHLQEQMSMIQGVMRQLEEVAGHHGSQGDGGEHLGGLGSAMLQSLERKLAVLGGLKEENQSDMSSQNDEASLEKSVGPSGEDFLNEVTSLFASHGLDMPREELAAMIQTEQGVELVEQVVELSRLRKQQESQLSQLKLQESNSPAAEPLPAKNTVIGDDIDRKNVFAMFQQRGHAISDAELDRVLSSKKGQDLAQRLREHPEFLETQSENEPSADSSSEIVKDSQATNVIDSDERDLDHANMRDFLLQQGYDATEADVDRILASEEGQEIAVQLRALHAAKADAESDVDTLNAKGDELDDSDKEAVRSFLQSRRGGGPVNDAELEAVLFTEPGRNLAFQLRELKKAESEQARLQSALQSQMQSQENSAVLQTQSDRDALKQIFLDQKGEELSDKYVDLILGTEEGRGLVAQMRQLSELQERSTAQSSAVAPEIDGVSLAAQQDGYSQTEEQEDEPLQGGIEEDTAGGSSRRDYVRSLLRNQHGDSPFASISDEELDLILSTPKGSELLRQLELAQKQKEELMSLRAQVSEAKTSQASTEKLARRKIVREFMAREEGDIAEMLRNVPDEQLDEILDSERGRQLLEQMTEATKERRMLQERMENEVNEEEERYFPESGVNHKPESDAQTQRDNSTAESRAKEDRELLRMMISMPEFAMPGGDGLEDADDATLDALIKTPHGQSIMKLIRETLQASGDASDSAKQVLAATNSVNQMEKTHILPDSATATPVEAVRAVFASRGIMLDDEQLRAILSTPRGQDLMTELTENQPSPAERDAVRRAVFQVLSQILINAYTSQQEMSIDERNDAEKTATTQAVLLSSQLEERLLKSSKSRKDYTNANTLPQRLQTCIDEAGGFPGLLQGSIFQPGKDANDGEHEEQGERVSSLIRKRQEDKDFAPETTRIALRSVLESRGVSLTDDQYEKLLETEKGMELLNGVEEMMSLKARLNESEAAAAKERAKGAQESQPAYSVADIAHFMKSEGAAVEIAELEAVLASTRGPAFKNKVVAEMMRRGIPATNESHQNIQYGEDKAGDRLGSMIAKVQASISHLESLKQVTEADPSAPPAALKKINQTLEDCHNMMSTLQSELNGLNSLEKESHEFGEQIIRTVAGELNSGKAFPSPTSNQNRPKTSRRVQNPTPAQMSDYVPVSSTRSDVQSAGSAIYSVEQAELNYGENGSPRPKTSRKMRHPSPDDFMDYVSPSKRAQMRQQRRGNRPGLESPDENMEVPSYQVQVQSFETKESSNYEKEEGDSILTPPPTPGGIVAINDDDDEETTNESSVASMAGDTLAFLVNQANQSVAQDEISHDRTAMTNVHATMSGFLSSILRSLQMMPLLPRDERIRSRFLVALRNGYVDSLRQEGFHEEAEHAETSMIAAQQEEYGEYPTVGGGTSETPRGFFAEGVISAPDYSPNNGPRQEAQMLDFQSPERRSKPQALDSAHSPYDYQESVRGSVSSSVVTDTDDAGNSLISAELFQKQTRSDSSSAAGSDAGDPRRKYGEEFASTSDGYTSNEQSWNPEIDGAEALSAVAQFNRAISDYDGAGTTYISGDDWQQTVAQQMRLHREMIYGDKTTKAQSRKAHDSNQYEMGSDSEDEPYDNNDILMPQWPQQEHEMLSESAAQNAFDSDVSSVRSSIDSLRSVQGTFQKLQARMYESAMESIKTALVALLDDVLKNCEESEDGVRTVVLTRKSLMRVSSLILRQMKKAMHDAAATAASLSSSDKTTPLTQWSGPVSLSNMRSPLSLEGKDATGLFVLDTHIKSTLKNMLMRYEGYSLVGKDNKTIPLPSASTISSSSQSVLSSEIVQDVMDLLYEESTWTKLAKEVEDSYHHDIEVMRASWQERLKTYEKIGQLGARHSAWERDREELTSRMGGLKRARDRDMKLLNAERRKRLEKTVLSNNEQGEREDDSRREFEDGFDPLDSQEGQNFYVADEYEASGDKNAEEREPRSTGYSGEEEESEVEIEKVKRRGPSAKAKKSNSSTKKRLSKKSKRSKKKKISGASSAATNIYSLSSSQRDRKIRLKRKASPHTKRGRSASPANKKKHSPSASRSAKSSKSPTRSKPEATPRSLTRMSRGDNLERSPQAAAFAAGLEMAAKSESLSDEGGKVKATGTTRIGVSVPNVSGSPIFTEEETLKYARSYNDAIAAAGSAARISREIEKAIKIKGIKVEPSAEMKTTSTTLPQVSFSYDGKLRELFRRARVSGVDWTSMFAVTDTDETGVIREADFRDALAHITSADMRFPGLLPDEMVHVISRFSTGPDRSRGSDSSATHSNSLLVEYKTFVQFYTEDSNHTDKEGFVSIGELPVSADLYNDEIGLEEFADKLANQAEAAADFAEKDNGGTKLINPDEYARHASVSPKRPVEGEQDQTSRLNKMLAQAMLKKMGEESPKRQQQRHMVDPAVMSEEELIEAMKT